MNPQIVCFQLMFATLCHCSDDVIHITSLPLYLMVDINLNYRCGIFAVIFGGLITHCSSSHQNRCKRKNWPFLVYQLKKFSAQLFTEMRPCFKAKLMYSERTVHCRIEKVESKR